MPSQPIPAEGSAAASPGQLLASHLPWQPHGSLAASQLALGLGEGMLGRYRLERDLVS